MTATTVASPAGPFDFPEEPDVPADQRATATLPLRYEDITQDGRFQLLSLPHAVGTAVWAPLLGKHPLARTLQKAGIVPILSRMVIEGGGGPLPIGRPVDVDGSYEIGHTVDEAGAVNRLMVRAFISAHGAIGRSHGPPPPNAGEKVFVGRVLADNVFTRLFAPPEARKVTRFDVPGAEAVPPARLTWRAPDELLALPADADPLDSELLDDPSIVAFGLTHTDSNQHVNSLVYPRLFEEAALRRLAERGRPTNVMSRFCEVAYRKPAFAGERLRVALRAFLWRGRPGAVGVFRPVEGAPSARPHVVVRTLFSE